MPQFRRRPAAGRTAAGERGLRRIDPQRDGSELAYRRRYLTGGRFNLGRDAGRVVLRHEHVDQFQQAVVREARASRRSSRSCRSTSLGGAATSTSAILRRCCATSTSGPGDGCAQSPGSSGNAGLLGSPSCDAAASAGIWRRKPLVARMALVAQQQPRAYYRSPERLPRLARPNFPRGEQGRLTHRTAVYGPVCTVVWEGEAVRPTPIPIVRSLKRTRSQNRALTISDAISTSIPNAKSPAIVISTLVMNSRRYSGPITACAARRPEAGTALTEESDALIKRFNRSGDKTMVVPSEYLEVVVTGQ